MKVAAWTVLILITVLVVLGFWLVFFGNVDWCYNQTNKRYSPKTFTPIGIDSTSDSTTKIVNNQIEIYGSIDEIMAYEIIVKLHEMGKNDNIKEIEIIINSGGGDAYSTFLICDAIRLSKKPIRTIAKNFALSGAAMILSCGTKGQRFATKNTQIMLHRPSSSGYIVGWRAEQFERQGYKIRLEEQIIFILISENTGQSIEQIRKDLQKEFYLTAEKAIQYGLIDSLYQK